MLTVILSIITGCSVAFCLIGFGGYLLDRYYTPPQARVAVKIENDSDLASLDLILCDVCRTRAFERYKKLTVLINRELFSQGEPDESTAKIIWRYGAEYVLY